MTRTIWPVGHGAFYTEMFRGTLRPVSMICDCGGKNMQNNVSSFLKILQSKVGTTDVDFLFISHFHWDHICGLKYLKEAKANVKNIFVPQLKRKSISLAEAYIYNEFTSVESDDPDSISFVQDLIVKYANNEPIFIGESQLIEVSQNGDDNVGDAEPIFTNERGCLVGGGAISSGRRILIKDTNSNPVWELIPINIFNEDLLVKLEENLRALPADLKLFLDNGDIDFSVLKRCLSNKECKEKIWKVYAKTFGKGDNPNIYSMPVYSGPVKEMRDRFKLEVVQANIFDIYRGWMRRHYNDIVWAKAFIRDWSKRACACLYMGDFEPENKLSDGTLFVEKLMKILGDRWHYLGMQQIPHHASPNNYSPILYDHPKLCFANVNNHKDRSCSFKVLQDIVSCNCLPVVVTETEESIFRCEIW